MEYIHQMWCAHIEISAACPNNCVYCTRYTRHLRPDQRIHMPLEKIEEALIAYQGWPKQIGFIGGEPLMHPQLLEINALARKYLPQKQLHFFTTGLPGVKLLLKESNEPESHPPFVWLTDKADRQAYYQELSDSMSRTFKSVHYHAHTKEQMLTCKHHPLTMAVGEVAQDEGLMWKLINNCWLQRRWSATVNIHGAYFCEVGAALDKLLYDGAHAWEVTPGWWKRAPHAFQEQVKQLCPQCGMCVPMETQIIGDDTELFSPKLFALFKEKNLRGLDSNVRISHFQADGKELARLGKLWKPGNYREGVNDIYGLYFSLEHNPDAKTVFRLDTEEDFAAALERAKTIDLLPSPGALLRRLHVLYKDAAFDPLYEQYPFVLYDNPQGQSLYYRAMLLYFRAWLKDAAFKAVYDEGFSVEALPLLPLRFRTLLQKKRQKDLQQAAASLIGREVFFWGGGEAYQCQKRFVAGLIPRCILMDLPDTPCDVDGIPVQDADSVLQRGESLPTVVFSNEINLESIKKKLEGRYAHLLQGEPVWAILDWTGPAIVRGWTTQME